LPALLSRVCVTSGMMDHDPSWRSKIAGFLGNYLTG
jgi:hypothetical protein